MSDKNEDFPSGLQAFFLVLALFLAEMFVGAALHDAQGWLDLTPPQVDAMVSVLGNGCLFAFVMHVKGLTYRELFHPSPASARVTIALLVPPVLMLVPALVLLVSMGVAALVKLVPLSPAEEAMFARMSGDGFATTLITCVIAPVVEEMLFRGVILRSFLHRYRLFPSLIGSAALFGFAHLNIYQFFVALVLGVISGWLYERTRSLIPCIALHASYNAALTLLDWQQRASGAPFEESASVAVWTGSLVLAAASTTFLVRVLRGRRAHST